MRKFVSVDELKGIIAQIKHGKFFSITFKRALPKCEACGRTSKKWLGLRPTVCPHCGGTVSYGRDALAQLGVHNPADKSIAPKGVGETFADKKSKGILGFYDAQAQGYRECHFSSIIRLSVDGQEYVVA